jgi:hypothetical protein
LQPEHPTFHAAPNAHTPIRVLDAAAPSPAHAARISAAWESLRAANPRYHDGPILVVICTDPLTVRRDTYRTLATAPQLDPSVRSLGVQGIVRGRDAAEHHHILFGRRSSGTRIYGGLWENAPSGGMTTDPGRSELTLADFTAALREEGLEELGLDLQGAAVTPRCLLDDPQAFSTDVVLDVRIHTPIDPRSLPCPAGDTGRWEYIDAAWVRIDEIRAWMMRDPSAFSPSTLALLGIYEPGTQ